MPDPTEDVPVVRVEANGWPDGTRLYIGDQDISRHVTQVDFHHAAREPGGVVGGPSVTVTFNLPKVMVAGRATFRGLENVPTEALRQELARRDDEDAT